MNVLMCRCLGRETLWYDPREGFVLHRGRDRWLTPEGLAMALLRKFASSDELEAVESRLGRKLDLQRC
jgi:hypothetical protein